MGGEALGPGNARPPSVGDVRAERQEGVGGWGRGTPSEKKGEEGFGMGNQERE